MNYRWLRQVLPFVTMALGLFLVSWCVIAMNQPALPPPTKATNKMVKFTVKNKKAPKKVKPRKTKRRRVTNKNAPPAPLISTGLSGPAFDLPELGVSDLTNDLRDELAKSAKAKVFTADTVDSPPKIAGQVAPEVPMSARRKAITGFVKVRYLITERGSVERLKVIDAKPKGIFEAGVLAALQQWTYEPAGYRGQPVRVSVVKTFRFN